MLNFLIQASLMKAYTGRKMQKRKTGSHEKAIPILYKDRRLILSARSESIYLPPIPIIRPTPPTPG